MKRNDKYHETILVLTQFLTANYFENKTLDRDNFTKSQL